MRKVSAYLAIVVVIISTQLPALATFAGSNGRIAFYDFLEFFGPPDVSAQIYTVAPDGSDRQQLTTGPRDKTDPAWSADGTRIAYASNAPRDPLRGRLVVIDADGQNPVVVAAFENDRYVSEPAWSPDGSQLAFCTRRLQVTRIWVVNADGSELTRISGPGQRDCEPDWSPDGSSIAFVEEITDDDNSLSVMAPDGSGRTVLSTGGRTHWPSWSPDGTTIAYSHSRASGNTEYDVVVIDVATLAKTALTDTPRRSEWTPVFSPEGSHVAFSRSSLFGAGDIWVIGADGSDPTRITDTDADEFQLSWQAI
jgi:TolB protein